MQTNQAADPGRFRPPELGCRHAPGDGSRETCSYLRALDRLRAWVDRVEQAHRNGDVNRMIMAELFLLYGEVSGAFDLCPDHVALPQLAQKH